MKRRSFLGENIRNGNSIVAVVWLLGSGGAVYQGRIVAAIPLGIAGLFSIVWNPAVAKTTTIIGGCLAAGAGTAWLLGMACNSFVGQPAIGYFAGLVVGVVGVVTTIDSHAFPNVPRIVSQVDAGFARRRRLL